MYNFDSFLFPLLYSWPLDDVGVCGTDPPHSWKLFIIYSQSSVYAILLYMWFLLICGSVSYLSLFWFFCLFVFWFFWPCCTAVGSQSLTRDWTWGPQQWKLRILTTITWLFNVSALCPNFNLLPQVSAANTFPFIYGCFFFFLFFWPCHAACGILVQPGIKPMPPALGAQSLNHWTTREVPKYVW